VGINRQPASVPHWKRIETANAVVTDLHSLLRASVLLA